jgi:hypothetical protein
MLGRSFRHRMACLYPIPCKQITRFVNIEALIDILYIFAVSAVIELPPAPFRKFMLDYRAGSLA